MLQPHFKMNAEHTSSFRLLVITPEGSLPQETYWVNRLFERGLNILHLRKPGWSTEQYIAYLGQLDRCYHQQVVVHHQPLLMEQFKLKGLHLRMPAQIQVKRETTLSCSVHSWQEFQLVQRQVDYAFISPFFDSISKKGYTGKEELGLVPPEANSLKAIALGGVDSTKIGAIQQLGLGGAAVLGAVWQSANPLAAFLEIQEKLSYD